MKRKPLIRIVLWAVFFSILILVFNNKDKLLSYYPSVSARYKKDDLTPDIVRSVLENSDTIDDVKKLGISFWGEERNVKILFDESTATSDIIFYIGSAANIYPVEFVSGTYPSSTDEYGCAISKQLAWTLFRNSNVVGMSVMYGDTEYIVRGVFDADEQLLALLPIHEEQVGKNSLWYSGVEFYGQFDGNREDEAKQWLNKIGLPNTDDFFDGKVWVDAVCYFSYLPIIVCVLWMFLRIFMDNDSSKSNLPKNRWIFFISICIIAILVSRVLVQLPAWLVPSQWSNFGYWDTLKETLAKMWIIWLSSDSSHQDIIVKNMMIKHFMLIVISVFSMFTIIMEDIRYTKNKTE